MPNKAAAAKAWRQSLKRHVRNLKVKSELQRLRKKVRRLSTGKNQEEARSSLLLVLKALDRAAQKGIIKRNTAARYKSRLLKK